MSADTAAAYCRDPLQRPRGHNKIPLSLDLEYARELCDRAEARYHLQTIVGQEMLRKARGWLQDIDYFMWFDKQWRLAHPRSLLCAARNSRYPPDERAIYNWCNMVYPAWCVFLWTDDEKKNASLPRFIALQEMD